MKPSVFVILLVSVMLISCQKNKPGTDTPASAALYFPPLTGDTWETTTPASLQWNQAAINTLYDYLEQKHTKAFIVLKDGKIVLEKYYDTFSAGSNWYWASAGKTVTAMLVGIAQAEGKLSIGDKTSKYLGTGWTHASPAKEDLITIRHQLTMTTGLDDGVTDNYCTSPECLVYKADAGSRWSYHNAPYTLLDKVIENATGQSFNQYFQQKIRDRTGMNGLWIKDGYNNVYWSTPRSMARYGLLLLAKGKWDQAAILSDAAYLEAQINSSQNLNPSYGYLTWLNGKSSYMLPSLQAKFPGMLFPNAPVDMYAALGKNDQKIYVVPSQNIVVIRMGESAGNVQLAVSSFDNELWGHLKQVIGY
ncbi:serine hydrolase domain-containing protein [Terrimonas rubra]|uniref:Serine hydrolase domain-containing protein n=1 Tax=Terrimonas rubra TaxID=1035890 RepID=A0ABW6ACZ5_9BACT